MKKIVSIILIIIIAISILVPKQAYDEKKTLRENVDELARGAPCYFLGQLDGAPIAVYFAKLAANTIEELKEEIRSVNRLDALKGDIGVVYKQQIDETLMYAKKFIDEDPDYAKMNKQGKNYYIGIVNICIALQELYTEVNQEGQPPSEIDTGDPSSFDAARIWMKTINSNIHTINDLYLGYQYSDDQGITLLKEEVKEANTGKTKNDIQKYLKAADEHISKVTNQQNDNTYYRFDEKKELLLRQLQTCKEALSSVETEGLAQEEYETGTERDTVTGIIILGDKEATNGSGDDKVNPDNYKPSNSQAPTELARKVGIITTALKIVGAVIAVIIIMVLGIKYMTGSVEEKANYKQTFIPYLVGLALIAGNGWIIEFIAKLLFEMNI